MDINLVQSDKLDLEGFRAWRPEYANAEFILNEEGDYLCGHEVEKMSKSKFNVQTPDDLVERYGADTLRCYEMFLGPLTQHKPWDTQGISGVHNFLRKLHRLFNQTASGSAATDAQYRILHKTIKKVSDDLDRHAFNTVISALMIGVNELLEAKTQNAELLRPLAILASPVAPHLAEELWQLSGGVNSVLDQAWPVAEEHWLTADEVTYPVSFNGKVRFQLTVPADLDAKSVENQALAHEKAQDYLAGKTVRKVIVVPGRIVNIVVG